MNNKNVVTPTKDGTYDGYRNTKRKKEHRGKKKRK